MWRYDLFLPFLPPRPRWGPQKDESSDVMWAFGGKAASEGLHLLHTTSLFKRDSAQGGGGEGSKIALPSTPTPNVGEWESFILHLTSRCLSAFWVESSTAGYGAQPDLRSQTPSLLSSDHEKRGKKEYERVFN